MRVEIVEVGINDAHYKPETYSLIGRQGTLATESIDKNGFASAEFYGDNGRRCCLLQVKTKPIYDA